MRGGGVGQVELLRLPRNVKSQRLELLGQFDRGGFPLEEGDSDLGGEGGVQGKGPGVGGGSEMLKDALMHLSILPIVLDTSEVGPLGPVTERTLVGSDK